MSKSKGFLGGALMALGLLVATTQPVAAQGAYSRLQVLLPGESPAPGTGSGKTGSVLTQTVGVPFTVRVRACDAQWNTVPSISNAITILSTDASASLPPTTQLANGQLSVAVTLNASGSFTIFAHDQTDPTIPDGTSASVTALVLSGFEFSRINQKNQYAGVPMSIQVTALDPSANVVSGYSGPVTLTQITSYGEGRVEPSSVVMSNGTWSGNVTMYRADETSINRGNVNLFASLAQAPGINGTSDPFTVHPGNFTRVQIIVPGQTPLPGSVAGLTGSPVSQSAGTPFAAQVYATDAYWNPVPSSDVVRVTSSDAAASTPVSGALSDGFRALNLSLGTVGSQTLTVNDQTNGGIQSMTSVAIPVIPSSIHHFEVSTISSPVTAGAPVPVTIRATDLTGNTVPEFTGEAILTANTGPGSVSPDRIAFTAGEWTGDIIFRGAGGAVSFTVSEFSSPPRTGISNTFQVQAGPFAGVQVILPGETAQGGTPTGKTGVPTNQVAGSPFSVTFRAVDQFRNLVSGVSHRIALGSSDAFAGMPAETLLANGQVLLPVILYKAGPQRIWVSDVDQPSATPDTSSYVNVGGGTYSKVLILAPGEEPAPGTSTGRTGAATDQSINFAFTVTVLATDQWWNPVGGITDVVRVTSGDPLAQLPPDTPMVDGRADLSVRLATGGFQQISVSNVSNPSIAGSSTQVRAISSGFHLEASVTPSTARAGEPFSINVRVTNDAGSVIQEINSFVTLIVQNANTGAPGRGTLLTSEFQLLQGQRTVSETYTFAEPIVIVATDDAGNAPAISNTITIGPGQPADIQLSSNPPWVGGNKRAEVFARLVDAFDNGVPGEPMTFALVSGTGTVTPIDSLTGTAGEARAEFLSPREPEIDNVRASSNGIVRDLTIQVALVDPTAKGGHVTNYPNPFHPGEQPTTIAYVLDDDATVRLRIFTLSGDLVREETFARGAPGGTTGLNEYLWDGRNGNGTLVASGGYLAIVEAQGQGETLHVMRRKIAAIR